MLTPKEEEYSMVAEWEPHDAVWLAWPSRKDLWQENLSSAQTEFKCFCEAISDFDKGEHLNILVSDENSKIEAEKVLAGLPARFYTIPFGDIWIRDTGPLFLKNKTGDLAAVKFGFNGWGKKYNLEHDTEVAENIIQVSEIKSFDFSTIMEGGSLEFDGEGTCLTSRQCLLNANRNPKMSQKEIETFLQDSLNVKKTLWLGDGLINDHTDGHIDTIARFSKPGQVLCMTASSKEDPNDEIFKTIHSDLEKMTDAKGRALEVVLIPSPGKILNAQGAVMPASFLNFYIANTTVIVPVYGSPQDDQAIKAISKCFPNRRTVGLSAKAILAGGGAFHCISQQQPSRGIHKS